MAHPTCVCVCVCVCVNVHKNMCICVWVNAHVCVLCVHMCVSVCAYLASHVHIETICSVVYQRGDTETQNGNTFCMLLGQVAITCRFQAQLCYVDSNAAELETRKLRPPASAAAA